MKKLILLGMVLSFGCASIFAQLPGTVSVERLKQMGAQQVMILPRTQATTNQTSSNVTAQAKKSNSCAKATVTAGILLGTAAIIALILKNVL